MLPDIDRLGPELTLLASGGLIILADLALRQGMPAARRGAILGYGSLAGILGSIAWAVSLILRGREGAAFDGSLVVDNFSLFFKFLFLGIAILVILASIDYGQRFGRHQGEYYGLILLATGGMMLLAGGRDLIAIFVALELTAISQYVMAALLKDSRSSEAGLKYLLLGAVSTAVLLYGMAFLFGLSGTTKLIAPVDEPSIAAAVAGKAGQRLGAGGEVIVAWCAALGDAARVLQRDGDLAEKLRHLLGRAQQVFGVGTQQATSILQRRMVANAGQDIVQPLPRTCGVVHVVCCHPADAQLTRHGHQLRCQPGVRCLVVALQFNPQAICEDFTQATRSNPSPCPVLGQQCRGYSPSAAAREADQALGVFSQRI